MEPYLLSGALNGVIAQRLVRTTCPNCATKYYPSENVLSDAGLSNRPGQVFRKGGGCQQCHNSGFQGRTGIYEVMPITSRIRLMVHKAAPSHEIRHELRRIGMLTLRQEGVRIAIEGKSSLEEVLRVTHSDDSSSSEGSAPEDAPTGPDDTRKVA